MRDSEPNFCTGRFLLNVFRDGALIEQTDEPNLIVANSITIRRHLLGGDSDYAITKIGYGTNVTAAAYSDIALTDAFVNNVSASYPVENNSVVFAFTLGAGDANEKSISEFGLLATNTTLYARKVRTTPLVKTSDITVTGTWIISF